MAIRIDKAVFLHIPKTGGTWVTNYFRDSGMLREEIKVQHPLGKVYLAHANGLELQQSDLPKFCFVRHPLTWYRSYWQMKHFNVPDRSQGYIDTAVDQLFHEFIKTITTDRPGFLSEYFAEYTDYCLHVGKQETLREDLNEILSLLEIDFDKDTLFHRKSENVIPTIQKYSWELAMEIMKTEKEIVDKYGYDYIPEGVME